MAIVYFLCGLAASGKTTYAKQLEQEKDVVRLTLDERMITKYSYSIFDEKYGHLASAEKERMWEEAKGYLSQGRDVVLDWSLWSRQARRHWSERVEAEGYEYKLIYLKAPLELLRRRLSARNSKNNKLTHRIPLEELERFSKIFEPPSEEEDLNLELIEGDS